MYRQVSSGEQEFTKSTMSCWTRNPTQRSKEMEAPPATPETRTGFHAFCHPTIAHNQLYMQYPPVCWLRSEPQNPSPIGSTFRRFSPNARLPSRTPKLAPGRSHHLAHLPFHAEVHHPGLLLTSPHLSSPMPHNLDQMDDPSRPSRAQDERRNIEEEEEEEEGVEEGEVASTSRDRAESRTDGVGRTTLPRDNVNVSNVNVNSDIRNTVGEPAAGRADQMADREQTEDHQRLDSRFRELRGVLPPPIPRTNTNTSTVNTGAAAGPLLVAEQNSYHGETFGREGGLAAATAMDEEGEEEADLVDRATARILWLEREQRMLAEQNGRLQRLLDDHPRQQHEESEPDNR